MKLMVELTREEIENAIDEYIANHLGGETKKVTFLLQEVCDYLDQPSGQYDLKGAEVEYAT